MNTFCTIISSDYLPFAKTLWQSLHKYTTQFSFHILITGENDFNPIIPTEGVIINRMDDFAREEIASDLRNKYGEGGDLLRWAIKPCYINFLLTKYHKVIYTDCDIHFFADPSFLFKELESQSMLLTPHWINQSPKEDDETFSMNFRIGMYNAGFIGATAEAANSLRWWAEACLYYMGKNEKNGYFDDQRYLDILPILDDKVKVLRHRGCNLGSWNITSNRRSIVGNDMVINGIYPVIFIHFNRETINQILNRNDALLRPYLDEYITQLSANGFDLLKTLDNFSPEKYETSFYKLKHGLRLRTRIKKFLHNLAEKL